MIRYVECEQKPLQNDTSLKKKVQKSFRIPLEYIILTKKKHHVFHIKQPHCCSPEIWSKVFNMKLKVLSLFLIYRGKNCASPWYGDQNCTKRHLLKSLQRLATIIIVFKGYSV